MLKILGILLLFSALGILTFAAMSGITTIDQSINQTALNESGLNETYDLTVGVTQTGFTMLSGATIFLIIAGMFMFLTLMFAAMKVRRR